LGFLNSLLNKDFFNTLLYLFPGRPLGIPDALLQPFLAAMPAPVKLFFPLVLFMSGHVYILLKQVI